MASRMASTQVSVDANQSFCSPRSSSICSAPMAMLSVAKPNASKRILRAARRPGMYFHTPYSASAPTGTLMKNTQRQL